MQLALVQVLSLYLLLSIIVCTCFCKLNCREITELSVTGISLNKESYLILLVFGASVLYLTLLHYVY